ncbi:MAG TPA: DUF1343 domain-containing protein [Bryobacteraceae bacterium]|nr:DUF1343 domain-containing protein [Bryobacteraceae bacterium]
MSVSLSTKCVVLAITTLTSQLFAGDVLTGLDVLRNQNFAPLKGKHIGLITNQTGLSSDGQRNVDLMLAAGIDVKTLFSPEHGLLGTEDQPNISDTVDARTGLPVRSLHSGGQHRITPEMVKGIDTLVYDIQDVGARFYTYSCTMIYSIEEASNLHLAFYVLDRPNPITGTHVEGPIIDPDQQSYVGCAAVPIRHGFTFGELAQFVNGERHLGVDLHVIKMDGWKRDDWWDDTDLTWVDPSPNMNSLDAAMLYPGICLLEQTKNFSVGRGTRVAYEQVGADWLDARKLAAFLNDRRILGVRAYPTRMHPIYSHFKDQDINGVRFIITDRNNFNSVRLGLEVIYGLQKLYPGKIDIDINHRLIGSTSTIAALKKGEDPATIESSYAGALKQFLATREKYLFISVVANQFRSPKFKYLSNQSRFSCMIFRTIFDSLGEWPERG